MKNKTKKLIVGLLAISTILTGLTACKDNNEEEKNNSGNQIVSSGEIQEIQDMNTYNNGGSFVQYKGKTYYREYSNVDIEKTGLSGEYNFVTEVKSTKYINAISPDGTVENIFEDDGYGDFYILDDRFFFAGYDNKLYSANMFGGDYIEFCKGNYVGSDEKNHRIFYKNESNHNALYMVDTQNLKITKLSNDDLDILGINESAIIFGKKDKQGNITISKLAIDDESITEICLLPTGSEEYQIVDSEMYEELLFLSVGTIEGSAGAYINGRIYSISLKNKDYSIIAEDTNRAMELKSNNLYFEMIEDMESGTVVKKKLDLFSMKLHDNTEKDIVSERELELFKQKYNVSSGDENYIATVNNIETVGDKAYYLLELSKLNPKLSVGWRDGYQRIASEIHVYDSKTGRKNLLYLYKASDKDQIDDEDVYGEPEISEPLAENEMYLDINLEGKGLKEEFEVRIEEVGGSILGKRIEYEGVHSRKEESVKIKVTKEIGAMLTVYIDNKIDSQMLIEE